MNQPVGVRTLVQQTVSRCYQRLVLRLIGPRTVIANVHLRDGGLIIEGADAIVHNLRHEWTPRPPSLTVRDALRVTVSDSRFVGGDCGVSIEGGAGRLSGP